MDRSARISFLRKELEKEPSDVFLNYALGLEYSSSGQSNDAVAQFKKVLLLDKDYIPVYYQLGKSFESQLMSAEALSYYRSGLEKAEEKKDLKAAAEFGEAIFLLEDE